MKTTDNNNNSNTIKWPFKIQIDLYFTHFEVLKLKGVREKHFTRLEDGYGGREATGGCSQE